MEWWLSKKHVPILIPGTCKNYLIGKRCDYVKGLKRRHLSWIIQVGPKCNHMYPSKEREKENRLTEQEIQKRRRCYHGGRDWNDTATSQGTRGATRSWEWQGKDFPFESP